MHIESWLFRAALLATVVFQLATHNTPGAIVAAQGLVVSFVPILVGKLSKTHVPRPLDAAFTAGMALQYISESTKLFEVFTYWDKIVHPTLVALTAMMAAWLFLGHAKAFGKRVPIQFGGAFALLIGLSIGAFWEFIEFASDWFGGANLQKSNADTMTDIIANDIGAFVATLFALYLFVHVFNDNQRREMGLVGHWLVHGPGQLFERHGRVLGAAAAVLFVAILAAGKWIDRGEPALASGLTTGQSVSLDFTQTALDSTQVLAGDWVGDPRGVCRVNLEDPKPGSEKPGVLQIAPGSVFGDQPFSVQARYYEERPDRSKGTEMDAGIAVGIRDAQNYDLVEQSALHDVLRLDRYIHNRRRDVREALFRTHGNEWHTLRVDVSSGSLSASVDDQTMFTADNLSDLTGGIGLWARTAATTCFSDVHVSVGGGGG